MALQGLLSINYLLLSLSKSNFRQAPPTTKDVHRLCCIGGICWSWAQFATELEQWAQGAVSALGEDKTMQGTIETRPGLALPLFSPTSTAPSANKPAQEQVHRTLHQLGPSFRTKYHGKLGEAPRGGRARWLNLVRLDSLYKVLYPKGRILLCTGYHSIPK